KFSVAGDIHGSSLKRGADAGRRAVCRARCERSEKPVKQSHKTLVLWLLIILVFVAFYNFFTPREQEPAPIAYSTLIAQVQKGEVQEITIKGGLYEGRLNTGQTFKIQGPKPPTDLEKMEAKGVQVKFESEEGGSLWLTIGVQVLPIVILLLLFLFLMRQLQA